MPKKATMDYPSLAILVPIWKEPSRLLKQNLELFSHIQYPGRCQVYWVFHHQDEKTIQEARILAKSFGIVISPKEKHLKASNLNFAVDQVPEDIISVFDVDDMFSENYFVDGVKMLLEHPEIRLCSGSGSISNKNASLLTRCQEMERVEWNFIWQHMIYKVSGGWGPVPGSGFIMWKKDLLEIGGLSEETVTEDIDLLIRLMKAGKKIGYFDGTYFMEAPTSLFVMMRQRARWYKGTLQLFKTHPDLKQANPMLHQTYLWTLSAQALTLLRLAKYPFVFACNIGIAWQVFLVFLFLVADLEIPHWEMVKRHGLLSRKNSYSMAVLDLVTLFVPLIALIDYWRRPLYWYKTPKRGVVKVADAAAPRLASVHQDRFIEFAHSTDECLAGDRSARTSPVRRTQTGPLCAAQTPLAASAESDSSS
jgi:cellulose synthase/poly-beta-1,6-N-acetylglucosamine synthase-like glycosyltransferase